MMSGSETSAEREIMKRAIPIVLTIMLSAALALASGRSATLSAATQETITGDWTAKIKETDRGPALWLSLNRNTDVRRGRFQMSRDFPLQDFAGLNPNANSNVQFTLRREAGVLLFDGLFKDGRGVGDFRFTPNSGFVSAMRDLGHDNLSTEKLFTMAVLDVNTNFINELKTLGYDRLSAKKLIELRALDVTIEFIKDAQGWGYGALSVQDLVEIKAMGVNPDFAAAMKALGFENLSLKKLVELKALGVNENYVREMRELGFENLTPQQLIEMKAMGVTADYVRKMRAAGLKNVSVRELIELKATGADRILVREKR